MNPVESALLRSWIQGVPWSEIGALYLESPDPGEAIRTVKRLRQQLHRKASLLRREADAALWGNEREYRPSWIHAALESLDVLSALGDPKPRADDPYVHWLPQAIARPLKAVIQGTTLQDLATFINAQGIEWWKRIPRFSHASAETVLAFFKQCAAELAIVIELKPLPETRHARALTPISDRIAPLEQFLPPRDLSGETGTNRAAFERCRLSAAHDYAAVMAWLSLWDAQSPTYRAYRKEAERLLLWAILVQGKPLSSLTTPDCAAYRRFLADPQPSERWIGKPAPRGSPAWRPFKGPLKPSSSRQAEVILAGLCAWLVEQRYLVPARKPPFSEIMTSSM